MHSGEALQFPVQSISDRDLLDLTIHTHVQGDIE